MRVMGIDFTSAPRRGKPITCAVGDLQGDRLQLTAVERLPDFGAFEALLARPGPWIAGLDFPFGQPRRLVLNLGWPERWADYVALVAVLEMAGWEALLKTYREARPAGDKHHLRVTDQLAAACSPMMLYGVPVGRMFFRGAPRLLAAGVCVLPCHPAENSRVVIETYPALVARRWLGRQPYKSDNRRQQTPERTAARQHIIAQLSSAEVKQTYAVDVTLPVALEEACLADASGDTLDAVLCALQTAWAYTRRAAGYGIPPDVDRTEGWIVDPGLVPGGG